MGQAVSGARLEDRYFLQKVKLGQGSFGTVWRAVDRQSNDVVAIKQLDKAMLPKRGVRRQDIEREVTVMQAVHHVNVTRLIDFFEDPNAIYMALEYCDGGDFGDKVKERGQNLQEREAAGWIREICAAISALHSKGICHRDIKPDNFMVHSETLKLSDFGLALFVPRGRLLVEKCGTPAFMAPEMHKLPRHSRGYSHPCDMWAAGICMYMMMFGGRHPFLAAGGNALDDRRLIQGALDFNEAQGFFGFGGSSSSAGSRFPEAARNLCRRMVEPLPERRISAEDGMRDLWITGSVGAGAAAGGRRVTAPPAPGAGRAAAPPGAGYAPALGATAAPARPSQDDGAFGRAFDGLSSGISSWFSGGASSQPVQPRGEGRKGSKSEAELQRQVHHLQQQVDHQRENLESQMELMQQLNRASGKLADFHRQPTHPFSDTLANGGMEASSLPLRPGTKCRYNSSSWSGWMPAVVLEFNMDDASYDLDVRRHARLDNISPAADVSKAEAWPPGTTVLYESSSVQLWLPAIIRSFNERTASSDGSYNLDVRDFACVDRIRPRVA